ncbi:MAG: hypothetical protein WCS30_04430 [Selenomonadaceae bacterium]
MSLMTAPAPWLNEIAQGTIKTPWGEMMQSKNPAEKEDEVYSRLMKQGKSHEVASAFTDVAPILAERLAIAQYAQKNTQIRAVAPELNNYQEALSLITKDRPYLTTVELDEILNLLKTDETMQPI